VVASLALALACTSCGGSRAKTSLPTATTLATSVARHLCPPRAFGAGALAYYPPGVLVPGHPTSVLICRYSSLQNIGLPGALAGALSVNRSTVTSHLASDFDSLPARRPHGGCPELGERSELFIFRYPNAKTARIRLLMTRCATVTNGWVAREGLSLHFSWPRNIHWADEGLL
jgi:hypothetical protein